MRFCKWEMYFWLLIALLVFLASCESAETKDFNQYFDTAAYINEEANTLLNTTSKYSNFAILNGEKEAQENMPLDSATLSEMVSLLTKANINKKIFEDQYIIDTSIVESHKTSAQVQQVRYYTNNDKLEVKWVEQYSNGNVKAMLSKNSFLFSYEKVLEYEKNSRFTVKSWQKIVGQDTLNLKTELVFLP